MKYGDKDFADTKIVKLRLIVDVDFAPCGAKKEDLEAALKAGITHLADNGMLSGNLMAEVDDWSMKVGDRE